MLDEKSRQDILKTVSCVNLLRKNFECTICIDYLDDPVLANCQHAFCKKCIESYIGQQRVQNCPLCKSKINMRALKRFPALTEIVSKVKKLVEANQKELANEQLQKELYPNKQVASVAASKTSPSPTSVATTEPTKRRRSSSSPNSINLVKKKRSNEASSVNVCPGPSAETPKTKRRESNTRNKNKESVPSVNLVNLVNDTITLDTEKERAVDSGTNFVNDEDKDTENKKNNETNMLKSKIEISMNRRALNDATNKTDSNLGQTATTSDIQTSKKINQTRTEKALQMEGPSYSNESAKSSAGISEVPLNVQTDAQKSLLVDDPLKFRKETSDITADKSRFGDAQHHSAAKLNRKQNSGDLLLIQQLAQDQTNKELFPAIPSEPEPICANNNEAAGIVNDFIVTDTCKIDDTLCFNVQSHIPSVVKPVKPRERRKLIKYIIKGKLFDPTSASVENKATNTLDSGCVDHNASKTSRNDASTNTEFTVKTQETSTQTELSDVIDMNELLAQLFTNVYFMIEIESVEQFVQERILYEQQKALVHSGIICDSPPIHSNQSTHHCEPQHEQPRSQPAESQMHEACNNVADQTTLLLTNESQRKNNTSLYPSFNDLLVESNKSKIKKPALRRSIPSLEFTNAIKLANNNRNQTLNEESFVSPTKSDHKSQTRANEESLVIDADSIIIDTPVKSDTSQISTSRNEMTSSVRLRELDKTLSKSANRMEFVNKEVIFDTSIVRFDNDEEYANVNESIRKEVSNEPQVTKKTNFNPSENQIQTTETQMNDQAQKNRTETSRKSPVKIIPDTMNVQAIPDTIGLQVIPDTVQFGQVHNDSSYKQQDERLQKETKVKGSREETDQNEQPSVMNSFLEPDPIERRDSMDRTNLSLYSSDSNGNRPRKSKAPLQSNQSILFNSMNTSSSNCLPATLDLNQSTTVLNMTTGIAVTSANIKEPPNAKDILGVSYNDSNLDVTALNETRNHRVSLSTSVSTSASSNLSNRISSAVVLTTKSSTESDSKKSSPTAASSTKTSNTKKNTETQLLTDSALFKIDNMCKELYTTHNQTICEEPTNSKSTESSSSSNESSKRNIEFVCSLLKPDMKDILNGFAKYIKAKVSQDVTDSTTHLIVDSDANLICGVTTKYLKAITRKIWIVSIRWILSSIQANQLLDPSKYEIKGDTIFGIHKGPMNARLSKKLLFDSHEFLFLGKFETETISLEDMMQLAMKSGARLVKKAKEFQENDSLTRVVLFDENVQRINADSAKYMLNTAQIYAVNKSWLLDSLACYKLRDMKEYQTYS